RSPYPLFWVDPLRVWVWGVCLCLGSSCLAVCLYSGVSEFVLGKTLLQMPSVYLHSLLSFSLCLMGRSADHQPNARSAQTGEADKLMGCAADYDPTGWDARRTMLHVDPPVLILLLISVDLGLKPEATKWVRYSGSRITSEAGISTKRAKRTNRRSRQTHGTLRGP